MVTIRISIIGITIGVCLRISADILVRIGTRRIKMSARPVEMSTVGRTVVSGCWMTQASVVAMWGHILGMC